jgi:hypothetical protein
MRRNLRDGYLAHAKHRQYLIRWIAFLDQQISTVADMLSRRRSLATRILEVPAVLGGAGKSVYDQWVDEVNAWLEN